MSRGNTSAKGPFSRPTDRRTALAQFAALASVTAAGLPRLARAAGTVVGRPVLATPEQVAAERAILRFLSDPKLKQIQREMRAELAAMPRGRMPDGIATLDRAIAQWTNSLSFAELCDAKSAPSYLWATDDTSRTWLGHTLGGVGTSGDNPDAVYRMGGIDGSGRYEVTGQLDMARRPAQFVIEVDRGTLARPAEALGTAGDMVHTVAMATDRDLVIDAEGRFRITINGTADGPNHFNVPGEVLSIGSRDMFSDWNQRPCRIEIRRLDATPPPLSYEAFVQNALRDLPGYIRFWAAFPDIWFGGLKPNTIGDPLGRNGGWGFVAGLRFTLADDEAMVITAGPTDARYTGFQLIDPWMIAPDARQNQVSLNNSQARPGADGTVTYVIAKTDPGVANWLDPVGMGDGLGIMRWQAIGPRTTKEGLIKDHRIVKLDEVAKMDLPRVSPAERRKQLAARLLYNTRVL